MTPSLQGAIDCDVHPAMPGVPALLPYLDDYWRDQIANRHIDRLPFALSSYPPGSPLSARPDWRQAPGLPGRPRADPQPRARPLRPALCHLQPAARRRGAVQRRHGGGPVLGRQRLGGQGAAGRRAAPARLHPAARARRGAVARARSSAWRPTSASCRCCCWPWARPRSAAASTGRCSRPARGTGWRWASTPAAPIAYAPTYAGWPSYRVEDYVAQSGAFETQLMSLDRRGRVPEVPRPQGGADRIGLHLAARTSSGGPARPGAACAPRCRGSTGRPPRSCATTCASRCSRWMRRRVEPEVLARTLEHIGSDRFAAVLHRLSALAVRRRRRLAGGAAPGHNQQDAGRQCARHLPAPARGGGRRDPARSEETVP